MIILIISSIAYSTDFNDYIIFSPEGYTSIEREIVRGGVIIETNIPPQTKNIILQFEKNNNIYSINVIYFERIRDLQSFWYSFVSNNSSTPRSIFSAVPLIYGEFNFNYNNNYINSWYNGINKTFFFIKGYEKNNVNELKKLLSNF